MVLTRQPRHLVQCEHTRACKGLAGVAPPLYARLSHPDLRLLRLHGMSGLDCGTLVKHWRHLQMLVTAEKDDGLGSGLSCHGADHLCARQRRVPLIILS